MDSDNQPFDGATRDALTTAVANTRRTLRNIPDVPLFAVHDEIKSDTDELNKLLDYLADIKTLDDARVVFEQSAQQLKQITNPSQDFVISRLGKVAGISDIEPINEENDVNKQLNKQGGYTPAIFFYYDNLSDPYSVYSGKSSVENNTSGGGCIEVIANTDGATKREEHLAALDGQGAFKSGTHTIYGTVLIGTSWELTATQQKDPTNVIEAALVAIE
ncbi:hypothetical protein [Olsenella profusa]|uniref:Uncharacterized protein n=1 Tax=Olsenella profusa F0195 TaxID=1125712 RepID=U2TQQ5_9ACTN|nr:hypothetical protein [Olsenella profusa]ERL08458.1 hypothetical protein HMPREF1316_2019 [Olsenella profusa F0195]